MSMPFAVLPPPPVEVLDLFPDERRNLLLLLASLTDEQWGAPTVCPGWTVQDVALHLLGVDVANISRRRDGFRAPHAAGPANDSWVATVDFVNQFNDLWVAAARRISPRLLCELLAVTGEALVAYFRALDLCATGGSVSWAGPAPSPVWLDVAREYTERWVHQQQIRDAVGQPGCTEPRFLAPVLAAFVHALPHTLRGAAAPPGTCLRLTIEGPAGGSWVAVRADHAWALTQDRDGPADATVSLDQETAWRLFTRGISRETAGQGVRIAGDQSLGEHVLDMVSIIA
jgi:uncharacterized protein (TIGR03083 family)